MKKPPSLLVQEIPYMRMLFEAASAPARRKRLLQYGSGKQINAVSELVLNMLKNRVDIAPPQMARLRRYKTVLREIGKRKNSIKKRRQHLLNQSGSGFWKSLGNVCHCHLKQWKK